MNLSEDLSVDKELFSEFTKENTMNLSEDLSVDKELFSKFTKENTKIIGIRDTILHMYFPS